MPQDSDAALFQPELCLARVPKFDMLEPQEGQRGLWLISGMILGLFNHFGTFGCLSLAFGAFGDLCRAFGAFGDAALWMHDGLMQAVQARSKGGVKG